MPSTGSDPEILAGGSGGGAPGRGSGSEAPSCRRPGGLGAEAPKANDY